MDITVKSHHVDITDSLKEYAEKKMGKLEHFFDHINSLTINLNIESSSAESDRQVASSIIQLNKSMISAKESSADMYASIDGLLDKLATQLKKYKDKLRHHKGHTPGYAVPEKTEERKVVEQKQCYIKKPMGVEDAVNVLNDENLNFLVFRDLKERISVVYQTDDDEIGLITT